MFLGILQILIIIYVLFVAIGPRRVVGWIHRAQDMQDRLAQRPPRKRSTWGWLRALELMEHAPLIGWASAIVGVALALLVGVDVIPAPWSAPVLVLAMLLLLLAPWLI